MRLSKIIMTSLGILALMAIAVISLAAFQERTTQQQIRRRDLVAERAQPQLQESETKVLVVPASAFQPFGEWHHFGYSFTNHSSRSHCDAYAHLLFPVPRVRITKVEMLCTYAEDNNIQFKIFNSRMDSQRTEVSGSGVRYNPFELEPVVYMSSFIPQPQNRELHARFSMPVNDVIIDNNSEYNYMMVRIIQESQSSPRGYFLCAFIHYQELEQE